MNISISVIIDDCLNESTDFNISTISVNESLSVLDFKNLYNKNNETDIYFIYRGELINNSSILKDLGLKDGSCVNLLIKKCQPIQPQNDYTNLVSDILKKYKEIMKTRSKEMINKIILEEMDNIIDSNPDLENDLIAYSIAFDYRLLRTLFSSRENVTRILEKHPVLIPAALKTLDIIQDRLKRVSRPTKPSIDSESRYFSLREVEQSDSSSTEDEDESSGAVAAPPNPASGSSITRSQLQRAIDNASSSSRAAPAPISLAQLRSAVHTAMGEPMEVDEPAPRGASANVPVADDQQLQSKLAQLRAMGFTNEQAARTALEAAGGNVEAAIEFLIL